MTEPVVSPASTSVDGLDALALWLRGFAESARAPAGQPNLVCDNCNVIAAHLEQYVDCSRIATTVSLLKAAGAAHNSEMVTLCLQRRVDTATPCGGRAGSKCADCPRRAGLSVTTRTLAG